MAIMQKNNVCVFRILTFKSNFTKPVMESYDVAGHPNYTSLMYARTFDVGLTLAPPTSSPKITYGRKR
jgi:hypothetical protein